MLLPINFAVGALVGAAAAYVYKDEPTKEALGSTVVKLKGILFKKKTDAVEDQGAESVELVEEVVVEAEEKVSEEVVESSAKS